LCIDYRALNAVTVKKTISKPIVEEQLAKLSENSYFTTLDTTSGYYQISMGQESKKFTAFLTPDGLYEFNIMPFGLLSPPMVFEEVEHQRNIISYVDEVIIPSKTVETFDLLCLSLYQNPGPLASEADALPVGLSHHAMRGYISSR